MKHVMHANKILKEVYNGWCCLADRKPARAKMLNQYNESLTSESKPLPGQS